MKNPSMPNGEYLELFIRDKDQIPDHVLLPHEQNAVEDAYHKQVEAFKRIIDEKVSVTGGDDWHDGAFRATDNEAKIIVDRTASIAPFLGATVISYPDENEDRITLGSRVTLIQNGFIMPVDIVGFRKAYPDDVVDEESGEEIAGVSPDSPLGSAILGKEVGQEVSYKNGERIMSVFIKKISQVALKNHFSESAHIEPSSDDRYQ